MQFRTYYNKRDYEDKPKEFDPNSSLTDQDFKMQTNVEYLLEHMAGHSRTPLYGMQETQTFEDWSNEMALLKRRFMHLSPDLQKQFGNAQAFLQWCSDPNNYKEKLPSVVQGRISEERLEKEKQSKIERAELYAKKVAEFLKKE